MFFIALFNKEFIRVKATKVQVVNNVWDFHRSFVTTCVFPWCCRVSWCCCENQTGTGPLVALISYTAFWKCFASANTCVFTALSWLFGRGRWRWYHVHAEDWYEFKLYSHLNLRELTYFINDIVLCVYKSMISIIDCLVADSKLLCFFLN